VYIGAGGPVVAKYAGRAGDGFICTSGKGEELYTDKLLPAVAEGAAAAGRDLDTVDKLIEIKISYDPDPEAALNNCRFWAPLSLTPEQKHSVSDPMEKVADYVGYGLNHLVFHAPGHDQRRFLELFERDLLPRLRKLS
jgi:coenzyme F420-dependent glucose-6-phosphate dehydrogenase